MNENEKQSLHLSATTPKSFKKPLTNSKPSNTNEQGRKRGRPTKVEVEERKKKAEQEAKLRFNVTIPAAPMAPKFDLYDAQNVVFKPNDGPQTEFLSAIERQVLFGGAAGGKADSSYRHLF